MNAHATEQIDADDELRKSEPAGRTESVGKSPPGRAQVARRVDDEWLVTNGLGGYATGTISGACTRRYHGLLIAALPAPMGRLMMLNHLSVEVRSPDDHVVQLDRDDLPNDSDAEETALGEFQLESGLPVWRYSIGPYRLEKRVLLPHLQNTVFVSFRYLEGPTQVRLRLRPSFHFRHHDAPVDAPVSEPYVITAVDERYEIKSDMAPPLRIRIVAAHAGFLLDGGRWREIRYRAERARGYAHIGRVWSPGYFGAVLSPGDEACLIASTEDWDTVLSAAPEGARAGEAERRSRLLSQALPELRHGFGEELVFAADQFLIRPSIRVADAALAHASGDEVRSVIAGYHWFTDWGRDTMISLEGLTLATGRGTEAGYILRTFSRYVRDGLIPNLFPEGERQALYHTADASLWYFHALERYLRATGDTHTLHVLLPVFRDIVDHHLRGTRFGIHLDPADGLLVQGDPHLPLTWMDAKDGDWIATPRRGKAVEINALWYNAVRLLERWCRDAGEVSEETIRLADLAQRARASFNERFWYEDGKYLYDVVDGEQGDDAALRPNQLFAVTLDFPVLDPTRWEPVLEKVTEHLLTPMGLRSLAPNHPDYQSVYDGDLRFRDAAYHQGTVWAWLIGPYVDAWLRVHPNDVRRAREFLAAFELHLNTACIGSISEIFDARAPFLARGCIAQAWSVAEVLRAYAKTSGG